MNFKVFLDIGANIGNHTIWFADYLSSIYAFEPNPEALKLLQENVNQNRLTRKVKIFPLALSDKNGKAFFFRHNPGNLGSARIIEEDRKGALEIDVKIGDEILNSTRSIHIDFMKIDVEGHEVEVLRGLRETIRTHRPVALIEYLKKTALKANHELTKYLPSNYTIYGIKGINKITQLFLMKEGLVFEDFNPYKDYSNILCLPKEKEKTFLATIDLKQRHLSTIFFGL